MEWPLMTPMRQHLDDTALPDFEIAVAKGIRARLAEADISPGQSVAIGVGSRGVSPIVKIVRVVVRELKAAGLKPFVVPAMGSHGGSTAEGQAGVLRGYGITPDGVGAEINATMDTVVLGRTTSGLEVRGDAIAHGADHIVIIARVKPHTDFNGEIESGLCKMTAIGLGKRAGAELIHGAGLAENFPQVAAVAIATNRFLAGVALVENPFGQPSKVQVSAGVDFHETDRLLLREAKRILPRVPVEMLHLLVVDEMGKNISGAGMDSNVVGMHRLLCGGERLLDYRLLAVLRLTEESKGNAIGIGMADFTTQALVDSIDKNTSYVNALVSTMVQPMRVPMTFPTDEECSRAAISMATRTSQGKPRIARIKNTLELEKFWVSGHVVGELQDSGRAEVSGDPERLAFDDHGELVGHGV